MSVWSRLSLPERRMTQMGDRNDADFDLATQSGQLVPEDYRAAVQACSGCSKPDACDDFLREGQRGIPDYCRNASLIQRLADVTPD